MKELSQLQYFKEQEDLAELISCSVQFRRAFDSLHMLVTQAHTRASPRSLSCVWSTGAIQHVAGLSQESLGSQGSHLALHKGFPSQRCASVWLPHALGSLLCSQSHLVLASPAQDWNCTLNLKEQSEMFSFAFSHTS